MIIMLIVVRGRLGAGGARRIIYQEPTMCKERSQSFCIHDLVNLILIWVYCPAPDPAADAKCVSFHLPGLCSS